MPSSSAISANRERDALEAMHLRLAEEHPPATWEEIEEALLGEQAYVETDLHDCPDYCIPNLCRLMYSFRTRDVVVSKFQTADWARRAFTEWARLIGRAQASYAHRATAEDRRVMLAEVGDFLAFARPRIEQADGSKR